MELDENPFYIFMDLPVYCVHLGFIFITTEDYTKNPTHIIPMENTHIYSYLDDVEFIEQFV